MLCFNEVRLLGSYIPSHPNSPCHLLKWSRLGYIPFNSCFGVFTVSLYFRDVTFGKIQTCFLFLLFSFISSYHAHLLPYLHHRIVLLHIAALGIPLLTHIHYENLSFWRTSHRLSPPLVAHRSYVDLRQKSESRGCDNLCFQLLYFCLDLDIGFTVFCCISLSRMFRVWCTSHMEIKGFVANRSYLNLLLLQIATQGLVFDAHRNARVQSFVAYRNHGRFASKFVALEVRCTT